MCCLVASMERLRASSSCPMRVRREAISDECLCTRAGSTVGEVACTLKDSVSLVSL